MKTKFFVDFDNTLFDTRHLKTKLFKIFESLGFDRNEVEKSYKQANVESGYNYSPEKQLSILEKIKVLDKTRALAKLDSIYNDLEDNLYPDSIEFLKSLNRDEFEVILLTLGDPEFQKKKVLATGVISLFDKAYYCTEQKWIFLPKLLTNPEEKFLIIDDRSDALYEISKTFKNCIPLEINRTKKSLDIAEKESPYTGVSVNNFSKAISYLKENNA